MMLPYVSDFLSEEMHNAIDACFASSIIDQFLSCPDFTDETDGDCESSVGAASLILFHGDTEMNVALTILGAYADQARRETDQRYSLPPRVLGPIVCEPSAWANTNAAIVYHDDQKWWGDASFFDTAEDAKSAFASFQQDYASATLLGYLDSLGLVAPAAWGMQATDALLQIREANAFSDEEWDNMTDAAWDAS